MDNLKRFRAVTLLLLMVFFLSACATQKSNIKSSVMEYLYPKSDNAYTEPSIPHLKLPLRIGIAFVPESKSNSRMHNFWVGTVQGGMLTEATKHKLLERVSESFRELDYVGSIEVIPTGYLTAGGSFSNLEQIKTMYGIDVIALVSYDQVQFTDEGFLSLSYWTIVGAY
ncbi:MAG: rhombotarget lipoprotein, partial [Gammaproteobacteria bacterium]|nr:rhombotarget lipoprotein [Gammaproteobacteria bacterium]